MNTELQDLFSEELSKKEAKDRKKLEKFRRYEEKRKIKNERKLEKKENREFQKRIDELKFEPKEEITTRSERRELEETKELMKELETLKRQPELERLEKQEKGSFLGEVFLGLGVVGLILLSADYVLFCYLKNQDELISAGILVGTTISFALALTVQHKGARKFFSFLACVAFIAFMAYQIINV